MPSTKRFLLVALSLLLLLGGSYLLAHATIGLKQGAVAIPRTTPCTGHTSAMTLTTDAAFYQVGDTMTVTTILANAGCGLLGYPKYTLYVQTEQERIILLPDQPDPIVHAVGLWSGQADQASFPLQVVGSGQVTFTALTSFEVHLGYPGPAYWSADQAGPLTLTIPVTDTEIVVLRQAAYKFGCLPEVNRTADGHYWAQCVFAVGHVSSLQIERFADEAQAWTAFEQARGAREHEGFHCYSAFDWLIERETMPEREEGHCWVVQRWLVTITSYDDTGMPIAPSPPAVSAALYEAAVRNGLFRGCALVYLPLVWRE